MGLVATPAKESPRKGFEGGLEGVPVEFNSKHDKNSDHNIKKIPPKAARVAEVQDDETQTVHQ